MGRFASFTPTMMASSVTISGSPFPLDVQANLPFNLQMDFDLMDSLQSNRGMNPETVVVLRVPWVPMGHSQTRRFYRGLRCTPHWTSSRAIWATRFCIQGADDFELANKSAERSSFGNSSVSSQGEEWRSGRTSPDSWFAPLPIVERRFRREPSENSLKRGHQAKGLLDLHVTGTGTRSRPCGLVECRKRISQSSKPVGSRPSRDSGPRETR